MIIFSKSLFFQKPDSGDYENLSLWRHDNTTIAGKTLLYNYIGSDWVNTLYVPMVKGNSVINNWVNSSSSGTTDANRQTPFYNNPSVVSVDLQYVPFRNDSLYSAFKNCRNLIEVKNINNSVTNMGSTFYSCTSFNQNIQIPNSVTSMQATFRTCIDFNQPITIPNSVTSMSSTFYNCYSFNQPITIPNSVTSMSFTFYDCTGFNQPITIPNSVTDMGSTFQGCTSFNQSITIPNSVTSMGNTFKNCTNFNQPITIPNSVTAIDGIFSNCEYLNSLITIGTAVTNIGQVTGTPTVPGKYGAFENCNRFNTKISILSTEIAEANYAFPNNNTCRRNIYIYFKYANGSYTKTYNTFKTAAYWTELGSQGSTNILTNRRNNYVYNAGKAPW